MAAGPSTVTLVLGGARSGKSEVAEHLAAGLPPPLAYVATAVLDPSQPDPDLAARVEAHRRRRPPDWHTVEAGPALVATLSRMESWEGTVLVDSLGTWVAATPNFTADGTGGAALAAVLRARAATETGATVLVSDEVGLGVHPSTDSGRHFRDALGIVNQAVADIADEVLLIIAGRVLPLERAAALALPRGIATAGED